MAPTVVGLSEIEWKRWREKERKDRLTNTKFELFLFLEYRLFRSYNKFHNP